MRILLVMVEPPLPFGNAAGRWYYVLFRELVRRGHQVRALAACSDLRDADDAHKLFPSPEYDLRCFPFDRRTSAAKRLRSFLRPMSYLFGPELRAAFDEEIRRGYDVLHMEHIWCAWLTPDSWDRTVVNLHYLFSIDLGDSHLRFVDRQIIRAEARLIRKLSNIASLSPRLTAAAGAVNARARLFTIPLGIDLALYPFDENPKPDGPPTVGIIGSFNWKPSKEAGLRLLHRLWPGIKRRAPSSRLLIVGRHADGAFPQASEMSDVTIQSDVPDAQPYFRDLDVLVYAPPVGSGMKVKVLEAFALGTPVVTNREGIEGIDAMDGVHCAVGADDDDLTDRAIALLTNPALRRDYRIAARALLEQQCGGEKTVDRVEQMYRDIVSGSHASHVRAAPARPVVIQEPLP